MNIVAFVNGQSISNKMVFGVLIRGEDGYHQNIVDAGIGTKNLSELLAVKYAILAIKSSLNEINFKLFTINPFVYGMLHKINGQWNDRLKQHVEVIMEIRNLVEQMKMFDVVLVRTDQTIATLSDIIKSYVSLEQPVS